MRIDRRQFLARVAASSACLAAPAALAAASESSGAHRHAWPPRRATPALVLSTLDGATWRLADQRGRPLLLNFWATWCEPCRAEMPALERVQARHADAGLLVLAVNVREHPGTVQRFIQATGLSLPVLRDVDGAAAKACGVRIYPSTLAIGRDGRARFTVVGEPDWAGAAARQWMSELLQT
ncbi:MAG TPA: TlpA disulfide reductase family protein [Rubrivivax sp.]|nr:TlpA disulfide reductase family protein [Rubrivivax sp.]